ncbi:hypothetical protein FRX31_012067 [Thalictrum thalictroides]|uniref:Uncharacterized protein n=1 Tax=Thalictrum thalictroides TaxID=46969 RepID=A0A7J6WLV2_THATH|nr:hypothetical protein FRX31_012067 [Thalictrum thalictroides]
MPAVQIPYLGHDFIHFKVNIWATTYFLCDLWYVDQQHTNHTLLDIFLYSYKLHANLCDHNNCYWIANEYGLLLKTAEFVQPDLVVPWDGRMPTELKKYNPKNKIPYEFIPKVGMPKAPKPGGLKPPGRGRGGRHG